MKRVINRKPIPNMKYFNYELVPLVLLIWICCSLSLFGQEQQAAIVDTSAYKLYHRLENGKMSNDGNWTNYRIIHPKADTMFVQNTINSTKYSIPGGKVGHFSTDNKTFASLDAAHNLKLINLTTGKFKITKGVLKFDLKNNVLTLLIKEEGKRHLITIDLNTNKTHRIINVEEFLVSPEGNKFAVITQTDHTSQVQLIERGKGFKMRKIAKDNVGSYNRLRWSANGNALSFLQTVKNKTANYCYNHLQNRIYKIPPEVYEGLLSNYEIDKNEPVLLSKNGTKLFFKVRQLQSLVEKKEANDVQIWNAGDQSLYSGAQIINGWHSTPKIVLWEPQNNRVKFITTVDLPLGFITENDRYSITYNPLKHEPQPKLHADLDLYVTDLEKGTTTLLLEKQFADAPLQSSHNGKFILYFRDKNWFTYNLETQLHKNLTSSNAAVFYDDQKDTASDFVPYGAPGWTKNDDSVLLYDQFDVWIVKADGSESRRITYGRESKTIYRIVPNENTEASKFRFSHCTTGTFDLKKGLLLKTVSLDGSLTGIQFLSSQTKPFIVEATSSNKYDIKKASENNSISWVEESYTLTPRLMVKMQKYGERCQVRTNHQHEKLYNHSVEILKYKGNDGEELKALLYYPVGYDKNKRYPMIVSIYEKQSKDINTFIAPSLYNGIGFNTANFTGNGYFVLLPDINYILQNVGDSALLCVENAVHIALENKTIDPLKVGLTGHSFGGFETNYIITKSNLFACAVAGAATSNFVSSYLTEAKNNQQPNFFKIEAAQARMGKSLYEAKEAYLKNSPVLYADQIKTPLLSWTGLEDYQVDYNQSFELYMALRRLGKVHILLAFPNEGHAIDDQIKDKELTVKIQQWFDHYLKDSNKLAWMSAN